MTGPSPEQIAALLSKREAIINRLCAEKKQLELQLVKARTALERSRDAIRVVYHRLDNPSMPACLAAAWEVAEMTLTEDHRKS